MQILLTQSKQFTNITNIIYNWAIIIILQSKSPQVRSMYTKYKRKTYELFESNFQFQSKFFRKPTVLSNYQ